MDLVLMADSIHSVDITVALIILLVCMIGVTVWVFFFEKND